MRSPRTLRSNRAGVGVGCFFRRPRTLAEIISSKLKVKYSCLNAYLSKSNFARGTEDIIISLLNCQNFVTNKYGRSTARIDFGKSKEKTGLLVEEVDDLWSSQLGSIQRGLFLASVEFSDIKTLPIFAMRQFLPFNQIDSMQKTQLGVVGSGDISDVYINNFQSFKAINILARASRGPEKAKTKAAKFGIERPYRKVMRNIFCFCTVESVH